ncbi:MAG: PIN domain-containing protein [Candidatus Aminicenantes bacterium]|nr:PIN domain-containing protein [Candidatus Aminicenantes bacterium]
MVLVDTSVWVDHFRKDNALLANLLNKGLVSVHPFVIGELACGNLGNRKEILSLLQALPQAEKVSDDEILFYVEKNSLSGKGLGLIDVHLLASAQLSVHLFWTKDRRLHVTAKKLNLAYSPVPI